MVEAVVTALAAAFVTGVFLFTMKRDTAIRFCAAASLILILAVPLTRLAPAAAPMRLVVPASLIALTMVMVIRARTLRFGAVGGLAALYLALGGLIGFNAAPSNAVLLYALSAVTIATALVQGSVLARTENMDWFWRCFIAVALLAAGYAVVESLLNLTPLWRGARILSDGQSVAMINPLLTGMPRAQATFGHPLPLGLFLVVALYLRLKMPVRSRFRGFLAILVLLGGVAACGSRNALVLAAVVLIVLWAQRLRAMRVPVILAAVIGGIFFILQFLDSDVTGTGSFTHRIGALESVGRLITMQDLPAALFGSGDAALPGLYASGLLQADGLTAVDNQLVYQLATTGIVGTLIVAVIALLAFRRGTPIIRGVLLILALQCLIFDLLAWPSSAFLAWLVVGAAVATPTTSITEPTLTDRSAYPSRGSAPSARRSATGRR